MFLSAVTLKIRSWSQSPNNGFSITKCCFHANFCQNQVIRPGDNEHITFWSKFSVFLSAVTLKIMSRSQSPNQGFRMSKCCIRANLVKIKLLVQEILSIISLLGLNLACFCLQ